MLFTIYDKATGAIVRSGDLPMADIDKLTFPPGSIIKYGEARAQPVAVAKAAPPPTDAGVMAKQIADLIQRVTALEKAKGG